MTDEERREAETARGRAASGLRITRKGRNIAAGVAVAVAVILILVVWNPFGNVGPGVGQVAPDFSLTTSTGGTVTLSAFRGGPAVLEFIDVDCEFCQLEAPVLASVFANYSSRGVDFVSVDIDFLSQPDSDARIEIFKSTYGTSWSYAMDSQGRVARAYGLAQGPTPTTFIIDAGGVIQRIFTGRAANGYADYAAALDALL